MPSFFSHLKNTYPFFQHRHAILFKCNKLHSCYIVIRYSIAIRRERFTNKNHRRLIQQKHLHMTSNFATVSILRCKGTLVAWQVYLCPSISAVKFNNNSIVDTLPPCNPALEYSVTPSVTARPSIHQLSTASGLLELTSQISFPWDPARNIVGSFLITACNGGTKILHRKWNKTSTNYCTKWIQYSDILTINRQFQRLD